MGGEYRPKRRWGDCDEQKVIIPGNVSRGICQENLGLALGIVFPAAVCRLWSCLPSGKRHNQADSDRNNQSQNRNRKGADFWASRGRRIFVQCLCGWNARKRTVVLRLDQFFPPLAAKQSYTFLV
jgi:hypothetical protein